MRANKADVVQISNCRWIKVWIWVGFNWYELM